MDSIVKYGAIAVGGYFVLKYMGIDVFNLSAVAGITTGSAGTPVSTGGSTSTSPQAQDNGSTSATISAMRQIMMLRGLDINSYMTSVDEWDYFYMTARGIAGPAPETLFPNVDRSKKYTFTEYWKGMVGAGFSGMGAIAHHVNPYRNPVMGHGFTDNLMATGMELYKKRTH